LIDNAKALTKIFYDYEIPYVEIKGGNIKSAVEIFSRVNSTGTEISEDFMLSARSYNVNSDFIFREEISKFLTSLQKYNFENLSRDTILNCISNAKDKIYFEIKTEDLLDNLAEMTINAFEQIEKAVKFLYERLHVLHAKLLPYPTQLIFLANFFRLNPHPREEQLKKLEDWFWITTYSNYFTLYSLSQQRSAHNIFCEFAKEKHDNGIFVLNDKFNVAEFPKKLDFTGVRTKALQLFLLNSVLKNKELQLYETVKEFVIFEKEGKRPANMLLRLSSEFEVDKSKKDTGAFISKNETVFLQDYFINEKIKILFEQNMTSEFLQERDKLISEAESQFINTFNEFLDCE
jgi:hypothetical protein